MIARSRPASCARSSPSCVYTVAVFMILGEIGINLGPLHRGAGIIGVALGFGSQSLVKDFLSGVFILVEDQFGVGDIVDLDGPDVRRARFARRSRCAQATAHARTARPSTASVSTARSAARRQRPSTGRAALIGSTSRSPYDTDLDHAEAVIARVADEIAGADADVIEQPEVWGVEQLGANGIVHPPRFVKTPSRPSSSASPATCAGGSRPSSSERGHRDPVPAADRLAPADAGRRQRRSELIRDGELDRAIELRPPPAGGGRG